MADVVVLNDPMGGQGSNNASKCANLYMSAILQRGDKTFDDEWMRQLFEEYWDYAKWVTKFSVSHLLPLSDAQMQIQQACVERPEVAAIFADVFSDPSIVVPWYYDLDEGRKFLQRFE